MVKEVEALNSIGEFLRTIRMQNGEILKNMAEKLNVSSAFLSAVENGKKKMPADWETKLKELYNLNEEEIEKLKIAVLESGEKVEINIKDVSPKNRDLAIVFARSFGELEDDAADAIKRILNKTGE